MQVAAGTHFRVHCSQLQTPRSLITHRSNNLFRAAPFATSSRSLTVSVAAAWAPPTVADTKQKFLTTYSRPLPGMYNTVVNELLVQQHLMRYNKNYQYDKVFALGFVSVFDQILDGLDEAEQNMVFKAYVEALGESPEQYRADADMLEGWAKGLSSSAEVKPDAAGDAGQQILADIASRIEANSFHYTKFFAIGLFRLLELTGAKDPKALGALVASLGVRQDLVNKDLMTYKGVLSKLSAAKELFKEYSERERRKQAERDAEKKAKIEGDGASPKSEEVPAPAVTQATES